MTDDPTIRVLGASDIDHHIAALSGVLMDCIEGGASVSFMAPFGHAKAAAFWRGVRDRAAAGTIDVLVADVDGVVMGTVQLVTGLPENQPHRADISKLLVHRRARNRGVGAALMRAVEMRARARGKTLLVLDTADPSAERLYTRLGWTELGRVPGYALFPDGRPCDTTFFYKHIEPASGSE